MIARILGEGQWELEDGAAADLDELDAEVERAVAADDQEQLTAALGRLLATVRAHGSQLSDDALRDSDLILPDADATVADVRAMLNPKGEGLIPG